MGSKNVSYTYDVTGIRSSKTVGSTVHRYVTQSGRVVRETYGARVLDFIYDADGRPFAVKYSADSGATFTTYYYVLNVQGDVMGLLNSNGTLIVKYTYDAWGKVLSVTNANGTPLTSSANIANINPLRYRSYYYDTESGFYYLQSRYYDPVVKRFINADSYASTGQGFLGYNMFAYCNNSTIGQIDDSGYQCCSIDVSNDYYWDGYVAITYRYSDGCDMPMYEPDGQYFVYKPNQYGRVYIGPYSENPKIPEGYRDNDVIVLDYRDHKNNSEKSDPSFRIMNSYRIDNYLQQKAIIEIIYAYNARCPSPTPWLHSVESAIDEWRIHNLGYSWSSLLGLKRIKNSCRHADIDNDEIGVSLWGFLGGR